MELPEENSRAKEAGLRGKIVRGLFWKVMENGGAQGLQFIVSILLARLLTPEEYGLVGIVMIFVVIANVIVQNGFSTALVRKKDCDETDFSSVCYFSLGVAVAMYAVLYAAAPAISGFYGIELLGPILRVLGLVLFPGAVISVQTAYVSRKMEFRSLFTATMAAVAVSGAVSIFMAYRGWGAWAMAGQQIAYYVTLMLGLFVTVRWRPRLLFSIGRIRRILSFGGNLLAASLIDTLFGNLYGLIIGKIYDEAILGAYNRGDQFPRLIVNNLGAAVQAVLLPAFSSVQEDIAKMKRMVSRAIRLSSFLVLPMLYGLFAVADTMVEALLGPRWLICVPYLRIMCVAYSFWPIHITNLQAINAVGRSDIYLRLEIIKKAVSILGLAVGVFCSPVGMVSIKAAVDFICVFINAWPNRKLLGYRITEQWRDILPSLLLSLCMCAAVYGLRFVLPGGPWFKLVVQTVCGILIYAGLAALFRVEGFVYLLGVIREFMAPAAESGKGSAKRIREKEASGINGKENIGKGKHL